ncbi:MAG: NAD(P)-dependent alcohol dehydrogenase [Acidobacteria bacterium]|nr:NAD(P)-dependent alcohol dehydrogenase [Acidobacteriota bacterium]MBK9529841.1 NAD(P)-dependent alcohol dehydrogenase [Acidobacteriota bacterium]MBP7475558.1 NAD(P)-dependent alcohol dehydrogenase [Pyrinomonadaceae bacterium]MBP9109944.1 NAD(P)-dependent alcohol dehydrogenase [Pyrinomonadaceae bacterium]
MIQTKGYATHDKNAKFSEFNFERRDVGANDILIDIEWAGICHSDIHQAKAEWEPMVPSLYPMVPGHEIVGRVSQVGDSVTKFKVGDFAGIGCFVDSCRECGACHGGVEQYCIKGSAQTYNSTEMDRTTPTYGGYSKHYVIDQNYALKVNAVEDRSGIAPLLCAGITTYSPLKRWGAGPGKTVAVAGLGGLGHMGVKIAAAMGAEVTVLSTSPSKEADARKLGATGFINTKDSDAVKAATGTFDILLDTISANHDYGTYLSMVTLNGVMVIVGVPTEPTPLNAFSLIGGNKILAGSMIGGIPETQEMLDFCAEHNVVSDVEVISPDQIEAAYDRTIKSDVRYRFVIDMQNA